MFSNSCYEILNLNLSTKNTATSWAQRRPYRLARIAFTSGKTLLHPAVGRHRRQYAAPFVAAGINEHPTIGRETGRLIEAAIADDLERAVLQIQRADLKTIVAAGDQRQRLAVRRHRGPGIIPAFEAHALGTAAGGRGAVELRRTAAVGREVNRLPVRRPHWLGGDGEIVGDAAQALAGQLQYIDFGVAVFRQGERQIAAIGCPGRRAVDAGERGDQLTLAGGEVLHPHLRALVLERYVSESVAVARPGRRHQRLR